MKIIGLCGRAGSGKSTVAKYLVAEHRVVPIALADHFKIRGCVDGLPLAEVFGPNPKSDQTRYCLQIAGTENGRNRYGLDYWIRHLDASLYKLAQYGIATVVVDDVRFPNEAEYLHSRGAPLWMLLGRGGLSGVNAQHASETEIDRLPHVTRIFDNGSENIRFWSQIGQAFADDVA